MKLHLTPRQSQIRRLMIDHLASNHRYPTVRELGALAGIKNPHGVTGHMEALAAKGYLSFGDGKARAYKLTGVKVLVEECS